MKKNRNSYLKKIGIETMRVFGDRLNTDVYYLICDFIYGEPLKNYNIVLKEYALKIPIMCSVSCKINPIKKKKYILHRIFRQSNATPCKCGTPVSEAEHSFCYKCATLETKEFKYHHNLCNKYLNL